MIGPNGPSRLWNVPYQRNPFFTGREDVLGSLHRTLQIENAAALSHPYGTSGLGGIGKTQIAVEYAYRYGAEYDAVFWVRADSTAALTSSFMDLAHLLNLPEQNEQDQSICIEAVQRWLRLHLGWLLICDNMDDLPIAEPFLPKLGPGHILFTTRAHALGGIAQRLEVQRMEPETGALLLLRRAGILSLQDMLDRATIDDRNVASAISLELDGLPLALDQAGAYVRETPCSLEDYLARYRTRRQDLLQTRGSLAPVYPVSVATTWSLSFEKVSQANPMAEELLEFCAFLASDPIPEELLTAGSPRLGAALAPVVTDPVQLDLACKELVRYSLCQRQTHTRTLTIHRLTQAVLQANLPAGTRKQWEQRAVLAVDAASPNVQDVEQWDACELWLPHALVCATWIEQEQMTSPEAAHLLDQAGSYLNERARYAQAEPLYQRALLIREQRLGPEHPDTAQSLTNLALFYQNQGKYAQAEPLYQRALLIREQRLGPEHPDTAGTLSNLAVLYHSQGKYAEAEPLLKRALSIREQQLGATHPDTATSLTNLAELYRDQGKDTEAEPLLQRVLAIYEQQLVSTHPDLDHERTIEKRPKSFDVCVVCALSEEARAFLEVVRQQCKVTFEERINSRYYYSYRFTMLMNNKDELLSLHISWLPRYGPQEMILHLSHVLEECQPRIVVMTGICAGDSQHVQLGDLIVAERTFTYDSGKFTLDEKGRSVHQYDTMTYQLDRSILQFLGLFDGWKPLVASLKRPSASSERLKRRKTTCHIAAMASGSTARADHPFEAVRASVRGTVAIDMEGAAFGLIMSRYPLIPWLVVKGVSDYADQNKNDTYRDYAARASALYALSFIRAYVTHERLPRRDAPLFVPFVDPSGTWLARRFVRSDASFPEVWNVPRRHLAFFTGRDHLLQQLFDGFRAENETGGVSPQALIGLSGIGKTQTVAEYAYRFREHYRTVLWVRAEIEAHLVADFTTIALLLKCPQEHLQDRASLIQTMQEWFQRHSEWLLIFDNADDSTLVYPFLPRAAQGHVLLTTRTASLQSLARLFVLDPLQPEDGALCILRRANYVTGDGQLSDTSPANVKAARELAELMNGLPLALEQAGAYIEDTGCGVTRYLDLYKKHFRPEIQQIQYGMVPEYPRSVASTWSISMSMVEQNDPAAAELLRLCAFLEPDAIPYEIFTSGANDLGPTLDRLVADPLALDKAIALLRKHSLLQLEVDRDTSISKLSIHRLIQEIIKDDMDQATQRLWTERAAQALAYTRAVDVTKVQVEVGRGSVMIMGEEEDLVLHLTNGMTKPMGKIDIELIPSAEYDLLTSHRMSVLSLPSQGSTDVCFRLRMKVARRVSINCIVNGVMRDPPFSVYASRDNPYIYGSPVDEGEFFGRQEELETIVQAVTKPVKQDMLVVGERRTGKTSLLYQVAKRLDVPFIAIYIVLNTCRPRTDDVLDHILHTIIQDLVERGILESAWRAHKFVSDDFAESVDEVLQEARRKVDDPRLILLLDEADFLLEVEEEPVSLTLPRVVRRGRHQVDERVQRVLRAALQSHKTGSGLRAVVTGTGDLSTYMLQHSSPFFNHFRFLHLKPLSREETRELIVKPAEMLGVVFSPSAIGRISSFSGCQPYYCQALCYEAFAHAQRLDSGCVGDAEVDLAERKICEDFFHAFLSGTWRRATRKERAVLAALARGEPCPTATHGNLQRLLDWQIVTKAQEHYHFSAGLFEQWTAMALRKG